MPTSTVAPVTTVDLWHYRDDSLP